MVYLGRFENGVVVFDQPVAIENGARVSVQPLPLDRTSLTRGSPEAIRGCEARWAGDPAELDSLLAEVQRVRDSDLTSDDGP